MKFDPTHNHSTAPEPKVLDASKDPTRIPLWRRVLGAPASAAMRLHQYRNLHSAMVYEALCSLDHCDQS